MTKKYIVSETLVNDSDWMLNGDIDTVIQNLQNLKTKYPNHHLLVSLDAGYNNISMNIIGSRQETDAEREDRLVDEKKAKEVKDKKLVAKRLKIIQEAKKLGLKLAE